jgi:hypothetical protein
MINNEDLQEDLGNNHIATSANTPLKKDLHYLENNFF